MKKMLFIATLFVATVFNIQAQETAAYQATNEGWMVSLDEAIAKSKKTGKPIMANFTGSDWCGWCKRLTAAVFSKDDFKKWADKNVVLLELDFPRGKKLPAAIQQQNEQLRNMFQVRGYPTVWVFSPTDNKATGQVEFDPYGSTGYKATVAEFTGDVDQMIAAKKPATKPAAPKKNKGK